MDFEGTNTPQAGDLLFYKSNRHSWFISKLISKYSHAAGEDSHNGHYCHVALIDNGADKLMEMTWPHARQTTLDISALNQHYDLELWRPRVDYISKCLALKWARQNLGMRYDWELVLFGLGDDKHKEVCSTFVRQAYFHAGIDLYPGGVHEKVVSPSELVTSTWLEQVW